MQTSHRTLVFAVLMLLLMAVGTHTALPRLSVAADSATPSPITPALTAPFAYGVASGDMTNDSAVLWTRTPGPATIMPELSFTPTFDNPQHLPAATTNEASDFTVKVLATGLKPGTTYFFRFTSGSDVSPVGSFKTAYAPDQHTAVTMAFTGDADWKWKPYPLLAALAKEHLDYFLFLGDLIYETTDLAGKTAVEDLHGYRSSTARIVNRAPILPARWCHARSLRRLRAVCRLRQPRDGSFQSR